MRPTLCLATVFHTRLTPAVNAFSYRVFYLCFPLSQIAALAVPGLSVDRFNLLSFYTRDHVPRTGEALLPWIKSVLAGEGLHEADGEVVLMCHPRLLGYVFNPVSFWFCLDKAKNLRAVLAEVNNTFGEHHQYLLYHDDRRIIAPGDTLEAQKRFHVSPFLKVEGTYRFRFAIDASAARAAIDYRTESGDILHTSVVGRRVPLTGYTVMRATLAFPFMTLRVVTRIHWQAVRLWWKKVRFYRKPPLTGEELTR